MTFYSASFHDRFFHYNDLKSKKAYKIVANLIFLLLDVLILGNTI